MMQKLVTQKATGRAKCRICGKKINKGIKELIFWSGQGTDVSHAHLKCMFDYVKKELLTR